MSEKAFPIEHSMGRSSGMDLRDYFAAKILPALYDEQIKYAEFRGYDEDWKFKLAKKSYQLADEMMKARELK